MFSRYTWMELAKTGRSTVLQFIRQALQRLGWPVSSLSDEEIAGEMLQRWYAPAGVPDSGRTLAGLAISQGIYAYLADSGNLDALCWSMDTPSADCDCIDESVDELLILHGAKDCDHDEPLQERRAAPRVPVREAIELVVPNTNTILPGWLVDVSSEGISFLVDTAEVPTVGTPLFSTVHRRDGASAQLGFGVVVRSELLTECLSLVCAHLEQKHDCLL